MVCRNPACLGNYDFDSICTFAIRRFVEKNNTIDMLVEARTAQEVEEISLVCLLDVEDNIIKNMDLSCHHSETCEVNTCRQQIKEIIEYELKLKSNNSKFNSIL